MICIVLFSVHGQDRASEIRVEKVKIALSEFILSMPSDIKTAYYGIENLGEQNITQYINENYSTLIRARDLADRGTKANTMEEKLMYARSSLEEMPKDFKSLRISKEQDLERFSKLSIESKQEEIKKLQQDNSRQENNIKDMSQNLNEYLNELKSKYNDDISINALNVLMNNVEANKKQAEQALVEKKAYLEQEKEILSKQCPQCAINN